MRLGLDILFGVLHPNSGASAGVGGGVATRVGPVSRIEAGRRRLGSHRSCRGGLEQGVGVFFLCRRQLFYLETLAIIKVHHEPRYFPSAVKALTTSCDDLLRSYLAMTSRGTR